MAPVLTGVSPPGSRAPVLALVLSLEDAQRPGLVRAAVQGGVDWVQLRDREIATSELLAGCDAVRAAAPAARILVNRRADVALASGADGVHLGFDAMHPGQARALLGADALVGVSAHAVEDIDAAAGASYAHLAPIHAPLSKAAERPALGTRSLGPAAARGIPVLAQGGIHAGNARAAIEAGAAGVAVTGAITLAEDPLRASRALRAALDG